MNKTLTILMLGGAKRVSMAEQLIKAGECAGYEVRIYSHELNRCEPIAVVGKIIPGSKYSEESVIGEINDLVKTYKVDILLPFIDPAIEIAVRCKEGNKSLFCPVSELDTVRIMYDKCVSSLVFEQNNIIVPKRYGEEDVKFPVILKPRTGSASKGIIVAKSAAEFALVANKQNYLIQEYIANREEYTLDCYIGMNDNEIKCIVPRIRIETAGGEVAKTQTCRIPQLLSLGEEVITKLNLKGAVTLQFIYDKDNNRFLLMEINPRLGGGVICSILAGANIAEMIVSDWLGRHIDPVKIWRDGALMTRYFKEVMFYNDGIK
ncbi:MAG: ATP-grasp domain-containing protein [Muribaculaceae bacterium]|nr:ATP-grasp domain-containing protein [Muribaculaceae bacterium]